MLARDRQTCNLAFDERQFESSNSSCLACGVNVRDARLLKLIDAHIPVFNRTSEQLPELEIRHEMITTREIITRDFLTIRQRHAFEYVIAVRSHDPSSTQISNTAQPPLQIKRLRCFAR